MTQGNPPPVPRRAIPIAPTPAIPIAAIPISSDPRGPIDYSTPQVGRPGMISAIGIISIIVASLSMLGSIGQAFYVTIFYTVSRSMAAVAVAPPPVPVATMPTMLSPMDNARGLSLAERDTVVAGLKKVRSLSTEQTKHLEALLATCGQDVILLRGVKLTANNVMRNVSDSGTLPSATGAEGPVYFVFGQGRVEVSDAQGAFFPTRGEVVRASFEDDSATAGATYSSGLTDSDISAIVARVQQLVKLPLNPAQVAGLTTELKGGVNLNISHFPSPQMTAQQVSSAAQSGVNGAFISGGPGGWISLDSRGTIINSTALSAARLTAAPTFQINGTPALILVAEAAGSFLLAIYLLVIGILTLRQSPRGGRLHVIYALIKIPLAVVAGFGFYWLLSGLFTGFPGGAGATPAALIISNTMGVVITCIYPIALLITLRTHAVREYYATAAISK